MACWSCNVSLVQAADWGRKVEDGGERGRIVLSVFCGFMNSGKLISGSSQPRKPPPKVSNSGSNMVNALLESASTSVRPASMSSEVANPATNEDATSTDAYGLCVIGASLILVIFIGYWHWTPLVLHLEHSGRVLSQRALRLAQW